MDFREVGQADTTPGKTQSGQADTTTAARPNQGKQQQPQAKPNPGNTVGNGRPEAKGADRNGDGRIDLDDLLIALREAIQWTFSWRGAMALSAGFTLLAGSLNVTAWSVATGSFGAGFLTWGLIQTLELMPALDDMNLKSSIMALVRLQRKPLEIPNINETLVPAAKARLRRYRNRERNQDAMFEAVRYLCYGLEIFVLVIGGGILTATGLSWQAILMALVGIVGVELGLRMFNICGEKLLSAEERDYLRKIQSSVSRSTTRA
jgi:hypothetical protein